MIAYRWLLRVRLGWDRFNPLTQHILFWWYFLICLFIIWGS